MRRYSNERNTTMNHRIRKLFWPRIALVIFVAVSLLLTGPDTAHAAGVVGDGTPASCTEAALTTALAGGGAVTFNCGGPKSILVLSRKEITRNTVIDGGGTITLTAGLATQLFHVVGPASLALNNITLDSAFGSNSDGGAIIAAGPLTLVDVTIQNSKTTGCGGAIWTNSQLTITHSAFNGNVGATRGGAICTGAFGTANLQISDTRFTSNQTTDTATGHGGAIYAGNGSRVTIDDSLFFGNSAHMGGAIYTAPNAALTLNGSPTDTPYASKMQLNSNSATEDGGALYNKGGALAITNTVLSVNRTPRQAALAGYGGAIYNEGTLALTGSVVAKNEGRYGGGVFVGNNTAGVQATIDRTAFIENSSGNLGGGLYTNINATTVTITRSAFRGNSAVNGGGLARTNAKLAIYDSSFTQNTATNGGGLSLAGLPQPTSGPYVRIQSVTVSGNTATSNHGGGVLNTGTAELYSMTIVNNTNGVWSGGGANTRFRDTVLQNPGSLNCDGDGTAQISDDTHNFATDNSCPLPNSQTGLNLDPKLGPLTLDSAGFTSYHMPLAGSPLIDAGFNCPPRDQLGASRRGACDIGAVEYGGMLPRVYLPVVVK
jgi:predicted outer membrane repeat protein